MKTTAVISYLKILKEYSPGSLVNASVPFVNLAVRFEHHFQQQTAKKLPVPHPRKQIVSSFFAKDPLDPSVYSCSEIMPTYLKTSLTLAVISEFSILYAVSMLHEKKTSKEMN